MTLAWRKLFDKNDLEIYVTQRATNQSVAITFDFSAVPGRPPHVPACNFFETIGFDQFHIVSKKDIWYQTPEINEVIEILRPLRQMYQRAITYGNSMGAYGALLISKAVEADDVLAFAPQYTVDSDVMPDEQRWAHATANLHFMHHPLERFVRPEANLFILYDPFCSEDVRHINLLRSHLVITEVKLPFAGHFPSSYLYENGVLPDVMNLLLFEKNPLPSISALRRRGRRNSSRYFVNLALTTAIRRRLDKALAYATIAYALDPDKPDGIEALLSIASRSPEHHAYSHIAIRLLQQIRPSFSQYDRMREEMLESIRQHLPLDRS